MSKIYQAPSLDEEEIQSIYEWVDSIPLTRPKRNITRDFADGVPMAEAIKHFIPGLVDLHNYVSANSVRQKLNNWNTLNTKVFKKMGFQLAASDIEAVVNCTPDAIERVLKFVQIKVTFI
jgi:CH-like domain in sperm protein